MGVLGGMRRRFAAGGVGMAGPTQLPGGTPPADDGRQFHPLQDADYFSYGTGPEHQFFTGSLPSTPMTSGTGMTNEGNLAPPKTGMTNTQKAQAVMMGVPALGQTASTLGEVLKGFGYDNEFTQGLTKYGNMAANPLQTGIDYLRGTGSFAPSIGDYSSGSALDDALKKAGITASGASPAVDAADKATDWGDVAGKGLGAASDAYGIYSGIKQGDVQGYTNAAKDAYSLAQTTGLVDAGASAGAGAAGSAGAASAGASGWGGGGVLGLLGLYDGYNSLTTKEGKAGGALSGAKAGYEIGGPWGALVGAALGYTAEGGYKDAAPYDAAGLSGTTMDSARKDQNILRLASNPAGAIASSLGVKSNSTLGKILDPAAVFQHHGDEKRNMAAFAKANPGIKDLGNDRWELNGKNISGKDLQWLAGTYYGATFHPDGDQAGWQAKYDQARKDILGAKRGGNISAHGNLGQTLVNHFQSGNGSQYVKGPGTGRSDEIPAQLSNDEYVMDAETVAMLGDGSPEAGAKKLDQLRENLRRHKGRSLAKGKFSPNAKDPASYMGAK